MTSPFLVTYTYRLALRPLSRMQIAGRLTALVPVFFLLETIYILLWGKLEGYSPSQMVIGMSVDWVWSLFLVICLVGGGYAAGLNRKNQNAVVEEAELNKKLAEIEAELNSEQNNHIRARLGSHFVLNALSNIIALVRKNRTKAAIKALHLLSDILREIAHADDATSNSLKAEIKFLESYLAFQKIRFPELDIKWNIAKEIEDIRLPKHILQPIVENAFKHGMKADGSLSLAVEASAIDGLTRVRITNSIGKKAKRISDGEGQALTSLRLQKLYNRTDLFVCTVEDGTYIADISIPVEGDE